MINTTPTTKLPFEPYRSGPGPGKPAANSSSGNWLGRIAAAILLLGLSPVMLLIAILVRVTSKGPIIFRQNRLGRDSRVFELYKFRTMHVDAEAESGPVWAAANDPRVTPIGGALRHLGLDELPQLFNVVRGDMAIVGPRPERPEIAKVLVGKIPEYYGRLLVRPGVTGLAQVNLPADTDVESVRKKLKLDMEYIDNRSFFMDARIVIATTPRLVGSRGSSMVRMLGVARETQLSVNDAPAWETESEMLDPHSGFSFRPQQPR